MAQPQSQSYPATTTPAPRSSDTSGTTRRPDPAEKPKPTRSLRPIILLVLAAAAFGGYRGYQLWLAHRPLEIGGTVEVRTVQVASRAGGRVHEVLVHEGDRVHAGQALITLDRAELEARRDEARAAVDVAQAQLTRSINGPRSVEIAASDARVASARAALNEMARGPRREDIQRAQAQLAAAESQLVIARQSLARATALIATQSISHAEFDNANAQVQSAEGNRDAARAALDTLQHGSRPEDVAQARARLAEAAAQAENTRAGSRDEDIHAARAQLAQAQARLALAEINLAEATVTAPSDCVVEALDLRPGDILAPNQAAATLVEDGQMFVRAYIPETQLGLVHVGDTVPFTIDTFGNHSFNARVEHVNSVGEYTPRNVQTADERANQVFLVRLGIHDRPDLLRAGMAATVHLPRRQP